jgi:hypothetical protein
MNMVQELQSLIHQHANCLPFVDAYDQDYQCSVLQELRNIIAQGETPETTTYRSFYVNASNIHNDANDRYGPFPLENYNGTLVGPTNTYHMIQLNGGCLAEYQDNWAGVEAFFPWQDQDGDDNRMDGWRMARTHWTHRPNGQSGPGHTQFFGPAYTDLTVTISQDTPMDMSTGWERVTHHTTCPPTCPDTSTATRAYADTNAELRAYADTNAELRAYADMREALQHPRPLQTTTPAQTFRDGW